MLLESPNFYLGTGPYYTGVSQELHLIFLYMQEGSVALCVYLYAYCHSVKSDCIIFQLRKAYIKLMVHLIIKLRQSLGIHRIDSVYSFGNQIANIVKLELYIAKVYVKCYKYMLSAEDKRRFE